MSVVNAGKARIANRMGVDFTYLACGTGTTAVAAGDTALQTELAASGLSRAVATVTQVTTTVTDDTLQLLKAFSVTGTQIITEVGVFNAASSGTMLARTILSPSKSVGNGDTYTLTYKIVFA